MSKKGRMGEEEKRNKNGKDFTSGRSSRLSEGACKIDESNARELGRVTDRKEKEDFEGEQRVGDELRKGLKESSREEERRKEEENAETIGEKNKMFVRKREALRLAITHHFFPNVVFHSFAEDHAHHQSETNPIARGVVMRGGQVLSDLGQRKEFRKKRKGGEGKGVRHGEKVYPKR